MNPEADKITMGVEDSYTIHHILAHSYSLYFVLFLVGVVLDFIYPIKLFQNPAIKPLGIIFLIVSSLLIIWAQKTSNDLKKVEKINKEAFCRGPYCYSRSPTHWGLFVLMLGFSILTDAGFVAIFTIIAFVITKFVFLRKEEEILAQKYGVPYLEYKKIVKF